MIMRPVFIAALGAIIGAVLGAPVGLFIGGMAFAPSEACSGTTCGFYGSMTIIAGLFGGAIIGAILGIRFSRPDADRPASDPDA
jgi:hypothetical protein